MIAHPPHELGAKDERSHSDINSFVNLLKV